MIHTINITCPPLQQGIYPVLTLNRYPILYIDDVTADAIVDDEEFKRIVKKYVKNDRVYKTGNVCIRTLNENNEIEDRTYKITDIY